MWLNGFSIGQVKIRISQRAKRCFPTKEERDQLAQILANMNKVEWLSSFPKKMMKKPSLQSKD